MVKNLWPYYTKQRRKVKRYEADFSLYKINTSERAPWKQVRKYMTGGA